MNTMNANSAANSLACLALLHAMQLVDDVTTDADPVQYGLSNSLKPHIIDIYVMFCWSVLLQEPGCTGNSKHPKPACSKSGLLRGHAQHRATRPPAEAS